MHCFALPNYFTCRKLTYSFCFIIRNFLFLIIFAFAIHACKDSTQRKSDKENFSDFFSLKGTLTAGQNKTLLFQKIKVSSFHTVDTILLDDNGSFTFNYESNFPSFYALKNEQGDYIILLPDSSQKIFISGDYDLNDYSVEGSPDSEALARLHFKTRQFLENIAEIAAITRDSIDSPDYPEIKLQLINQYDTLYSNLRRFSADFIDKHALSPVIIFALYNKTGPNTYVFDPVKDLEIFMRADSILYYLYPEFSHVKSMHDNINLVKTRLSVKAGTD